VRVVRYSDAGFDVKPYRSKIYYHSGNFYNYRIDSDSLTNTVSLYEREAKSLLVPNPVGCFAFLGMYDETQISKNGNLHIQYGARKNIGYLRLDDIVYARNIQANMKSHFIGEIIREIPHPKTGILHEFPESSIYDRLNWIQMPVSVFLERSMTHYKLFGQIHEIISEVFLTEDQVMNMIPSRGVPWHNFFSRRYKVVT
jgi:hypothetical protein